MLILISESLPHLYVGVYSAYLATMCSRLLVYWWLNQRHVPGPRRVPLVGSLPFLTTEKGILDFVLDNTVTKHRIARVDLGIKTFYVINDFSLAKSLFDKPEFCGRVPSRIQLMHRYINHF